LIVQAAQRVHDELASQLGPHALAARSCGVLIALFDLGDAAQHRVRALLGLNRHAMVDVIDALEGDGLLFRYRYHADRRTQVLRLTGRGHEQVPVLLDATDRVDRGFAGHFSEADRQGVRRVLIHAIRCRDAAR
jgi:DNA-binding MarR family transcriptional regulator